MMNTFKSTVKPLWSLTQVSRGNMLLRITYYGTVLSYSEDHKKNTS